MLLSNLVYNILKGYYGIFLPSDAKDRLHNSPLSWEFRYTEQVNPARCQTGSLLFISKTTFVDHALDILSGAS